MNVDLRNDRFDTVIRDALRWQAEQAPDLAPPFDEAIRSVARRVGGDAGRSGDVRRTWVLLAATVMLLTLLIGTLAIGAGLIRLPWTIEEPPDPNPIVEAPAFGFGGACRSTLGDGLLLEVSTADGPRLTLHADGTLVTVDPAQAEALAFGTFTATITERRLTARGIELVTAAITDTGLTPGCRDFYGAESVSFRAATSVGPVIVSVGTFPGAYGAGPSIVRVLEPAEEAKISQLVDRLSDPAAWLPPDAWADDGPRDVVPDLWEIAVGWYDSGQSPGDVMSFPSGKVINGANPDFGAIRLPDGEPIDEEACMVASTAETQALADVLDEVSHMQDFGWYVFSEDLTREYAITAFAVVPGEEPCAAPHFAPQTPAQTPEPSPPPNDACEIIAAADVESILGSPVDVRPGAPITVLDSASPTCTVETRIEDGIPRRVVAAIIPRELSADEAAIVAPGLLGAETPSEPMGDGDARLWLSPCWSLDCPPSLVAWSGGRLFLLAFDRDVIQGTSYVSLDEARALATAIASAIALP